jgi:hypothetical protein
MSTQQEQFTQSMSEQRPLAHADIVFVLDATLSMSPFIQGVIFALLGFLDILEKASIDAALGLVVFRDELIGEQPVCYDVGMPAGQIREVLRRTVASGGGDRPESSLPAIHHALDLSGYRPDAQKILLLITDAPPHDPEGNVTSEQVLERLCAERVLFFACCPRDVPAYVRLVNATEGTLFSIEPGLKPETFKDVLLSVAHVTVKQTLSMQQSRTIQDVAREELRKTQILVNKGEGE